MLTQQQIEERRQKLLGTQSGLSNKTEGQKRLERLGISPIGTEQPEQEKVENKNFLQKTSDISGKVLSGLQKTFINPIGKAVTRPFVSTVQGLKGSNEPVKTPFGEIKPYSEMKKGETAWEAVEVASFLPLQKLFIKGAELTGKTGKGILKGAGELLTGVPKENLNKWFNIAKNTPEKIKEVENVLKTNPTNPMLGLAENLGNKIQDLKQTAQTLFQEAVEKSRQLYKDTSFNLENKTPELNKVLNKFNLKVKQTGEVLPTTGKTSPYKQGELRELTNLVEKMRVKDMTVDQLLDFDKSVKRFYDDAVKNDFPELTKLGYELTKESTKFIDEVLPETNKANKLYSNYYKVMEKGGNKIIDSQGNVKKSAEQFLSNLPNKNKGIVQKEINEIKDILGKDIIDEVSIIKLAQELSASQPYTLKNRLIDVVRGIVGSKALGYSAGAGAGTGTALEATIPALLIHILTKPNVHKGLIEATAKLSNKLPITEVLKSLKPEDIILIQQLLKGGIKEGADLLKEKE